MKKQKIYILVMHGCNAQLKFYYEILGVYSSRKKAKSFIPDEYKCDKENNKRNRFWKSDWKSDRMYEIRCRVVDPRIK